jgi:small subunit ribosomal protein S16
MLTIRFARVGKRNKAQFKIMLQESTEAPGGRHMAVLGSYDPHSKQAVLKEDKIRYWLEKGASVSDTVHNLLVSKGLITDKKRTVKIPKKAEEAKEELKESSSTKEEKTEEAEKPNEPEEKKEEKKEEAK